MVNLVWFDETPILFKSEIVFVSTMIATVIKNELRKFMNTLW